MRKRKIKESFSSRTSRSDEGILALTNSVLEHIFGLTPETRSRMLKIVHNQGQWQDLKMSVRGLSGVAHRRLNDVVNMAQDANVTTDPEPEDIGGQEQDFEDFDINPEAAVAGGNRFESMSFAGYLLNELSYDAEDLRDPNKKQEIMRMMRASPQQAEQLAKRAQQEEKREQRSQVATATNPQKAQLLRKKETLQRQIQQIDNQLSTMTDTGEV